MLFAGYTRALQRQLRPLLTADEALDAVPFKTVAITSTALGCQPSVTAPRAAMIPVTNAPEFEASVFIIDTLAEPFMLALLVTAPVKKSS